MYSWISEQFMNEIRCLHWWPEKQFQVPEFGFVLGYLKGGLKLIVKRYKSLNIYFI